MASGLAGGHALQRNARIRNISLGPGHIGFGPPELSSGNSQGHSYLLHLLLNFARVFGAHAQHVCLDFFQF